MVRGNAKATAASAAGAFGGGGGGFGGFGSSASSTGTSLSYLAEPPSFAAVSDPQVVVALKNVLKKDSTTKSKALEELVAYVQAHPFDTDGGVEDALLEVWVQIYPRTSIDNSRRVRELSHNLQLDLLKSTRKRMERLLFRLVATWLAGLFDKDRAVSRAANAGLASFLTTPEKLNAFWRKCQPQILDFAIKAILETQDSLSDERSTTKEDAEAKYYRVIHASLCLINGLLQRVTTDDLAKLQERYKEYFEHEAVWSSITSPDPSVRKAVCHLLFACLDRKLPYAESPMTRQAFVTGGLKTNQAGSALEYIRALTKLTETHPQIWAAGKEKKSPQTRLHAFIAKGSQGSPPKYWEYLDNLIQAIPEDNLTLNQASSLLNSLKSGVTHREEPRTNTSYAWKCYIDTAKRLLSKLSPDDQLSFSSSHLFPFFEKFIFSPSGNDVAIPTGPNAMGVFVEAHIAMAIGDPRVRSSLGEEWNRLAETFCANIAASLPEVSKEYKISQDRIGEEGRRWFGLVGEIRRRADAERSDFTTEPIEPSNKVIAQTMKLLESRNMKPYGAARIIEFALSTSRYLFEGVLGTQCLNFLSAASEGKMATIIQSPSSPYLLSSLRLLRAIPSHYDTTMKVWTTWVNQILELSASESRNSALASLISSEETSKSAQSMPDLQVAVVGQIKATARGEIDSWDLLEAAVAHQCLTKEKFRELANSVLGNLKSEPLNQITILRALESLVKAEPKFFSEDEVLHTELVSQLLGLSEGSSTEVSTKASTMRSLLEGHGSGSLPIVGVIQSNLESAGLQSLSVETLARQAQDALKSGASVEDIFPSTNTFLQELNYFLAQPVDPSLAIMSTIGDTNLLIKSPAVQSASNSGRDIEGRAVPVRLALYISTLLENGIAMTSLPTQFQVELLYLQCLVVYPLSDQISSKGQDGLWKDLQSADATLEAEGLVSTFRNYLFELARSCNDWSDSSFEAGHVMPQLVNLLVDESRELTPKGLYSARVLCDIAQIVSETNGLPPAWEEKFLNSEALKVTPNNVLPTTAVLSGMTDVLQSSKAVNNFCNRLVSDVAGAKADSEKTPLLLVLLTQCAQVYEQSKLPVANNRIVFAVKQITGWFQDETDLDPLFSSLSLRCLAQLLPCMKDVYGSYWEKTLGFCIASWRKADQVPLPDVLPLLHASLKLIKLLETVEEPNDDLQDALNEFAKAKAPALIELLRLDREASSQPLEIVDAMLCREVEKLSNRQIPDAEELFGLVASESRDIQTAAFSLLHKTIPVQQEQKAVDALLDKTDARLPDELLSLLLDAPTLEKYSDEHLDTFPTSIRGYLLSWHLIFDAYSTSPSKVRTDFTAHLRAENHLAPLLDFTFDVLGHSAAHPLNLNKAGITETQIRSYNLKLAEAESEERSMQWLLVHVYYLVLKYTPGLFRQWYLETRSKQTCIAVESWTETYFSPLITSDALDEVQAWALDQSATSAPDDQELLVKVSKPAKEITAGYEIDESSAAITINLPAGFPLTPVTVSSLRRVAVSEKKWQSWILTTQGVITFSNGNIIDGLIVFKRNITGALKGQSECAICYSVISTDQRMPDKRCTTCKNLFHRTCLYKWFQSSSQNTCPLCRNPIDYLGADTAKRRQ